MSTAHLVFLVVLAAVAGSYTWGMRGTIIGGEQGAMLPGAALGLILAFAAGHPAVTEAWFIPAAAGAASMFFGGAETYGETIGMSHDRENKKRRRKGRIGLTVKGAVWFGIYGGVMAVCLGAMAGRYSIFELCLFTALLPASKWLGFFVLNFPQKPAEGRFPRFYFSEGRFEVWGGLLFVNLMIVVFAAVKGEWFPVIMVGAGLLSGGLGFLLGNLFQTGTRAGGIDGKYRLGKLQKNGFVCSWKFMEFTLGALGGLGTTLCFCLCRRRFVLPYLDDMRALDGAWNPLSGTAQKVLLYAWLAVFVLYVLRFVLPDFKNAKLRLMIKGSDEVLIWPVYAYIPLLLVLLGSAQSAAVISVFLIFWALAEEILFTPAHAKEYRRYKALCLLLGGGGAVILALQLMLGGAVPAMAAWLLYCLSYEAVEVYGEFGPSDMKRLAAQKGGLKNALLSKRSSLTVRAYSGLCVAVMIVMGAFVFHS